MKITKTNFYLLLIFVIALIFRIIAAHNTHVSTDEMVYSILPLNIISAGRLGTIEQSPLFFYLTDFGYKILGGITAISIRSTAIIFGSLAVLVIFLITQELFKNKKVSLISSFIFALSGFSLTNNYEMNMAAFFFALLSMLFFIKALKGNHKSLYLTSLFLALGALMKSIVLLFVPVYALIWLIYGYKKKLFFTNLESGKLLFNKKSIKIIVLGIFLAIIIISPILIYNYFIYQSTGYTDNYFSQFTGIGNIVNENFVSKPWELSRLSSVTKDIFSNLFFLDTILLVFGCVGIFFSLREKNYHSYILVFSMLILFLYVGGQTGSSPHFLWVALILSIFSGYGIYFSANYVRKKFQFKQLTFLLLILVIINSIFVTQNIMEQRENSITLSLREYVNDNIPDNAVVVLDARIYRGIYAWVFNDKHYLEGSNFGRLIDELDNIMGSSIEVPLYFFECGPGTRCGWKPEDFEQVYNGSEELASTLRDRLTKIKEINAVDNIIVYEGLIKIPMGAYQVIDQNHNFWGYPVGWKYPELAFDTYKTHGIGTLLNFFGFVMLYFDVLLSLLTIPFVFLILFKKEEKKIKENEIKPNESKPEQEQSHINQFKDASKPTQPFYTEHSEEKKDE